MEGDYRDSMVEHLRESHRTIASLLAEVDFEDSFPFVFGHPDIDGAGVQVQNELALLLRKAQMHITAVIRANRSDNLHSVAVHARVILECAAQVQFKAHAACEGSPGAMARVLNAGEYDFPRHATAPVPRQHRRGRIARNDHRCKRKGSVTPAGRVHGGSRFPTGFRICRVAETGMTFSANASAVIKQNGLRCRPCSVE